MAVDENYVRSTYVVPFYRGFDRGALIAAAQSITLEQLLWLLECEGWREHVAAALFALRRSEPEVLPAVLDAIGHTHGSYGLQPLVATAYLLAGADTIETLQGYQRLRDTPSYAEGRRYVGAALERLDAPSLDTPTDVERQYFLNRLDTAESIRAR